MPTATSLVPNPNQLTDVNTFVDQVGDALLYGDDAAAGELYNVMGTLIGDEMFLPQYGSNLPLRVFDPITASLDALMMQDVFLACKNWCVHVTVSLADTVIVDDASNRAVGIDVAYSVNGTAYSQYVPLRS